MGRSPDFGTDPAPAVSSSFDCEVPKIARLPVCQKCVVSSRDQLTKAVVSPHTFLLIMLLSPKGREGTDAPDILSPMTTDKILAAIDEEIARLEKVRALLSTSVTPARGQAASPVRKSRRLSSAARKRIAEAQRKRWAMQKGSATGK
jgi:hypothetical protein